MVLFVLVVVVLGLIELGKLFCVGGYDVKLWSYVVVVFLIIGLVCVLILWCDYLFDCYIGRNGWVGFGFVVGIGFLFVMEMVCF